MKCNGIDPASGEPLEISFGDLIDNVDPVLSPADDSTVYIAPGWIDLQVNGFAGVDYNSPAAGHEEISKSIRAMFATGVTRFFPTVITGSPEDMTGALHNLAEAKESIAEGAAMEAFHVEGPYISPEDGPRGAHPQRWVRPPDLDEFRRFQDAARGNIRLMTLSPEWPNAPRFIENIVREGVVASIGHTRASAGEIADAVRAGATLSTHIGNGAHSVLPRHPNYIWEQLAEDRLAASFIVDGIHLPKSFLNVALRAKGVERSILVTDAVMPAGCAPGIYRLGEVEVELHSDGSVRLRSGTRLAGSALRMDRAIQNVMRMGGVKLRDAVTMATRNPARVGRIPCRQRGLTPGERADLVRFRYDQAKNEVQVLETYLSGQPVATGS
ncbi:MAG TPA: amidohydrolase family protein [Bryobacteraceae bacterium]|nr:amidohydrolase family protein [Bryobacteraceae bacterium]